MNNAKIIAAKRLVETLNDNSDIAMHLLGHPEEEAGLDRLLADIANFDPQQAQQQAQQAR